MEHNKKLWNQIIELGIKNEPESKGIANKLNKDDVNTILATMEFFQATDIFMKQTHYDLTIPRFRVFDWLAMCVMGRNDDDREQNNTALQVLVFAYLSANGDVSKFIENLRINDYEINTEWESIQIDIENKECD